MGMGVGVGVGVGVWEVLGEKMRCAVTCGFHAQDMGCWPDSLHHTFLWPRVSDANTPITITPPYVTVHDLNSVTSNTKSFIVH